MVVPGHGAPFTDLPRALDRAEALLAALRRDPDGIRRTLAMSSVAFLAMARPELGLEGIAEVVRGQLQARPPFCPGPDTPSAQALVQEAVARHTARRSQRAPG